MGKKADSQPDRNIARLTSRARLALAAIVLFALCIRCARLNAPPERYFDEVYHAYTAQKWVEGNTDAWVWRVRAPDKGCSYEWTHPPLAKLMMQWSMDVFGVHPWAWRLPAALMGTICVLLIFDIARSLSRREDIALMAAALASLDTLPLALSRIGMNDVYCVAFILAAVAAAVRGRYVIAPLATGLALACKWTTLYSLPFLAVIHLIRSPRAVRWKPTRLALIAALYAVFVPGLYLASYIPFFRAGYGLADFRELQWQMWHYHTHLKAEHPFASKAWQWPFDVGTVWCYTKSYDADAAVESDASESEDAPKPPPKAVANVYAMGNPVIWLPGLAAIVYGLVHVIRRRDPEVVILLAGYTVFWAPWLASPRIMFLYHYLPSLPFLYIATAWALVQARVSQKNRNTLLIVAGIAFALMYPYVTAVAMPYQLTPNGWYAYLHH